MSVEAEVRYYDPNEFVTTSLSNKVSKSSQTFGTQAITLSGKTIIMDGVVLRGDLAHISVGSNCYIGSRTIIRSSYKKISSGVTYFPMRIGSRVIIEEDCVVMAAEIGNSIYIEKNCLIGHSVVIKDCSYVTEGTVLSADSVVPPFSIVSGNPGRVVGTMPANTAQVMNDLSSELYCKFSPTVAGMS
ncbi:Dynactin 5 [Aphelenchoides besseyi]|nr:Dynactin 5 [Aphelenchoides besseyi]KAI6207677.1 Dynactin 5 [Aphelenchoides besseyi]